MIKKPAVIFGLGNPGKEYLNTYHNAGALFVGYLADRLSQKKSGWRKKSGQFVYEKLDDFILVKPLAFMNQSGPAVKAALKHFKIDHQNILIAHDDSDIKIGNYKLSFGRGAAGHHGIESVIQKLGTKDFWRLRIGVRNDSREKAGDFVLETIKPNDQKILEEVFSKLREVISNY